MVKTYKELLAENKNYSNPKTRISRLVKNKSLFKIVRNIYDDQSVMPFYYYASYITFPSYISFDTALSIYGMIPEGWVNVTSATYRKNKIKIFKGDGCSYKFQDVPSEAFPWGIIINEDKKDYPFQIATKEKALLDKLYLIKNIKTIKDIRIYLFDDLRVNEDMFYRLDVDSLIEIARLYKTTTLNTFIRFVNKEKNNGKFIS